MRITIITLPDVANPEPQWQAWFTFSAEPLRAAGQRLRVYAGASDPAPAVTVGEDQRFGNAPANGFVPAFPVAGLDLRLVGPDGRVGHTRRFLPASSYSPSTAAMLRAADGTGLILFKPSMSASGSQLDPAEYRLGWEYRLDNRAIDPGSLVLSRNGDSSTELAQIDVPRSIYGSD